VMQVKSYIQNGKRNLKIIMLSMSQHESWIKKHIIPVK
jgi:hypothetical protein